MRIPIVLAAVLLAAACSAPAEDAAAPSPTTPASTTTAAPKTPPRATTKPTPRPTRTPAPVTVDAPCPYADAQTVAETVGQRIARTTVTRTRPHPGCAFYRPNGEKAADIAVSVLASVTEARTRAVRIPGAGANPVDSVADGGTVAITPDGAVLAVSEGATLVVVRINQTRSLEAVELARLVVRKV